MLPELGASLGCDYMDQIPGHGPVAVFTQTIPGYIEAIDKAEYLDSLPNAPSGYSDRFFRTANLFRHAPVLDVKEDGSMTLVPLTPLPESMPFNAWGNMIGFGVRDPSDLLQVPRSQYKDASKFSGCSFISSNGSALQSMDIPAYKENAYEDVPEGTPLPLFAELDFNAMPIVCMPSEMLIAYAGSRVESMLSADSTREEIESAVKKVIELNKPILHPDRVPKQIDKWNIDGALKGLPLLIENMTRADSKNRSTGAKLGWETKCRKVCI